MLQDFVLNCSEEQLQFLNLKVNKVLPLQAADFTCLLPRVLCLYLFSFLDPRSLCRCAQVRIVESSSGSPTFMSIRVFLPVWKVSWHWKSIVELDQLWMPKCLRRGWCITFSPSPFEQGVWKRHYIESVQELQLRLLQVRRISCSALQNDSYLYFCHTINPQYIKVAHICTRKDYLFYIFSYVFYYFRLSIF